jgi:patatin-like phospholipase/acyl hydrolase
VAENNFRILSLDGGGSKGIYSLGVLGQLEVHLEKGPLCNSFDLIYGTSTGAIIAALIGLGFEIKTIHELYLRLIPDVMSPESPAIRTSKLEEYAKRVFENKYFDAFKTRISIVATNYDFNRPMIFKSHADQTYSMRKSFEAGFGCTIADAVMASTAAIPFFEKRVISVNHGRMTLIDGGFVANNPAIFALTDATGALGVSRDRVRLLSIGTGRYAQSQHSMGLMKRIQYRFLKKNFPVEVLDAALNSSANTTEILTRLLFPDIKYQRIDEPLLERGFETNLLEYNEAKLGTMRTHGINSFGAKQAEIAALFG